MFRLYEYEQGHERLGHSEDKAAVIQIASRIICDVLWNMIKVINQFVPKFSWFKAINLLHVN